MEDSHSCHQHSSSDVIKNSQKREEDVVEELILDYACKNYMQPVISEILRRKGPAWSQDLRIPHPRFLAATLHSIVHSGSVKKFDHALKHLQIIHDAKSDLVSEKHYVKLTAGLKTKAILDKLETGFDYASVCAKLNRYFPKAELSTSGVNREQAKLNNYQLRLRRKLTRLILTPCERQAFLQDNEKSELGAPLTASIKDLITIYTTRLNDNLTVPVVEQIASEGPDSQIAKDVQDSPTSCMDHLLSICFKGPPTQEQLVLLLNIIKEERAGGINKAESDIILTSSSSSDDEKRKRRSTRSKTSNQRGQSLTTVRDKSVKEKHSQSKSGSTGHKRTKNAMIANPNIHGGVADLSGSRASVTAASEHTIGRRESVATTDRSRKQKTQTLSDDVRATSQVINTVNQGHAEKQVLSDELTEETRLDYPCSQVMGSRSDSGLKNAQGLTGLSKDQPGDVVTETVLPVVPQNLTPRSKIYFSRTSARVSRSQETGHALSAQTGKKATNQLHKPARLSTNPAHLTSQTTLNDRGRSCEVLARRTAVNGAIPPGSQQSSGSSDNSTQSTTSLSLLSGSRDRVIQPEVHVAKKRRSLVRVEQDQDLHSEEYTGSVTVIEETPIDEANNSVGDSPPDQCNIISSSSGSSCGPSQPSQCLGKGHEATRERQDSNACSTMDGSIIYPTPDAVETSTKFTFLRTPMMPTQESSSDSVVILASDSEVESDGSVVSDSEESTLSEDDYANSSEVSFTGSRHRRRIPSLRSYLQSPVRQLSSDEQVTSTSSYDRVLIIKPCAVVLRRLEEAEVASYTHTQGRRRSKRRRQMAH